MKYISTRGVAPALDFADTVLAGLASDGGLYVPETIPHFSPSDIAGFAGLPYTELCVRVMLPFVGDTVDEDTLRALAEKSYAGFRHAAIAPLNQIEHNQWVLELFHGPTLAFKDFALQFLGNLLDHILERRDERLTILGATSGDTGSAAIEGCRGCNRMSIFILHPNGRVSDVQRRQMTTVQDANVHNIALEGDFDDCQNMVKTIFGDSGFRQQYRLGAVNSINWARILAQVVYYVYAAVALGAPARRVSFSVPTGNFGDIYAGYIAKRAGLPVDRLVIATNRNDILNRAIQQGSYSKQGVEPTISPSMDIQISSNFERMLFDMYGRDGAVIQKLMAGFQQAGSIELEPKVLNGLRQMFDSASTDDARTRDTIARIYRETGMLLDPHTATGVRAAQECRGRVDIPMVTLATAHPAKFPDAVTEAGGVHPSLPPHLADLLEREERFEVLANDAAVVKDYIAARSA